jgi:hypothetical protein
MKGLRWNIPIGVDLLEIEITPEHRIDVALISPGQNRPRRHLFDATPVDAANVALALNQAAAAAGVQFAQSVKDKISAGVGKLRATLGITGKGRQR